MKTFALAVAATVLAATPASAAKVLFSFTGSGQTGSGTLTTADPLAQGGTPITGITGLFNGSAITGLQGSFGNPDNLFYFADPIKLSFDGVSFTSASGAVANLYYSTARDSYRLFASANGTGEDSDFYAVEATFAPLAGGVPEPGVWALMLLGFGMLGGALRRRVRFAAA